MKYQPTQYVEAVLKTEALNKQIKNLGYEVKVGENPVSYVNHLKFGRIQTSGGLWWQIQDSQGNKVAAVNPFKSFKSILVKGEVVEVQSHWEFQGSIEVNQQAFLQEVKEVCEEYRQRNFRKGDTVFIHDCFNYGRLKRELGGDPSKIPLRITDICQAFHTFETLDGKEVRASGPVLKMSHVF